MIHRTFSLMDSVTNVTIYAQIMQFDDSLSVTFYGVNPEGMDQAYDMQMRIAEALFYVTNNTIDVQLASEHHLAENAIEPLQTVVPLVGNLKEVARRVLKRVQLARQAAYQRKLEKGDV